MVEHFFGIVKEVSDRSDLIFCNREEAEIFSKKTSKVIKNIKIRIQSMILL